MALAAQRMKAGADRIDPAPAGSRPDLTGLSCRWQPMRSRNGTMLSVIAVPGIAGATAFREAVAAIVAVLGAPERFHPVPEEGPAPAIMSSGTRLEAQAAGDGPLWRRIARAAAHNAFGWALFRTGMRAGSFDPAHYRALAARNADCRKFGDALHLTADCDGALETDLTRALAEAQAAGALAYGLHRQDAALMTCIVPSYQDDGHYHFIDGAGGGYTAAAADLRARQGCCAVS